MQIRVDWRLRVPVYVQIVEQIKQLIASGGLKAGDQLPTVRQLAADLRVNFNTVARAYRLLDEAGVISTQHGRGTYILETPSPARAEQLRRKTLEELTRHYLDEARRLGYTRPEVEAAFRGELAAWGAGQPGGEPPPGA